MRTLLYYTHTHEYTIYKDFQQTFIRYTIANGLQITFQKLNILSNWIYNIMLFLYFFCTNTYFTTQIIYFITSRSAMLYCSNFSFIQ